MMWRAILHDIPWAIVTLQALNILAMLIVWQLTKHYYHMEWLRFAPDKARDIVQQAQAALANSEVERQRLETEVAKLRGAVEGARARLKG